MANQFRDYCITINNPTQTDNDFAEYLKTLSHLKYFIFQREKGEETGTTHIQLYIEFTLGKRFDTIKNYFPTAHIENRKAKNKKKARDYCCKEETRIEGCQVYEHGTFVDERERSDLNDIIQLIKDGATDNELLELYPTQAFMYHNKIQIIRQTHFAEKFKTVFRELQVTYIYGAPATGKTRYVMEKYGYDKVYRLTHYDRGLFDAYKGEDVILFEEFRSSLKIEEMLNYLDGYPLMLPSRYNDKVAQYTKVYLISNIPFTDQYKNIQENQPSTWLAFKRRIHHVKKFPLESTQLEITLTPVDTDTVPF